MEAAFVKRGRLEIIYEILSVCRKPTQKTHILYKCNLSYEQLLKYLKYLISHGLLGSFEKKRRPFFHVTDKGRAFLEGYKTLRDFVRDSPERYPLNLYARTSQSDF